MFSQNGCCRSEDDINNGEAELSSSDSDSEPPDSPLERLRMYPVKPRPILQRRNTITGTTPTNKRPVTSIAEVRIDENNFIYTWTSINKQQSSLYI